MQKVFAIVVLGLDRWCVNARLLGHHVGEKWMCLESPAFAVPSWAKYQEGFRLGNPQQRDKCPRCAMMARGSGCPRQRGQVSFGRQMSGSLQLRPRICERTPTLSGQQASWRTSGATTGQMSSFLFLGQWPEVCGERVCRRRMVGRGGPPPFLRADSGLKLRGMRADPGGRKSRDCTLRRSWRGA